MRAKRAMANRKRPSTHKPHAPSAAHTLTLQQLMQRALASYQQRDWSESARLCRQIVTAHPRHFDALHLSGAIAAQSQRNQEAVDLLTRAVAANPNHAGARNNLGTALRNLAGYELALENFEHAVRLKSDYAEAHNNRGAALVDLKRYAEALESYHRAIELKPDYADAYNNRGKLEENFNRHAQALADYERAVELNARHVDAHVGLGLACLGGGNLARGWAEYEWRWQKPDFAQKWYRRFPQPLWPGPAASGTGDGLLVWGEQGLGDEILYSSMLPDLVERGLDLVFETDPRMISLFTRSFPWISVVARATPPHALTTDAAIKWQVPIASLGRWLRPDLSAFPHRNAFLVADNERVARLRDTIQRGKRTPAIGLAWQSRGLANKSLGLQDLAPIVATDGVTFVDLQYGDTAAQRQNFLARHGREIMHLPDVDLFNDLEGVAALVGACDLIITSSSAVAHFAGALGKTAWILLPLGDGSLWYWFRDTRANPWYPSARLFRQPQSGDWAGVVREVASELTAWKDARSGY